MCTLYTFSADQKQAMIRQIASDWASNPDGGSMLVIDKQGDVESRIQTTSRKVLLAAIHTSHGSRYVVHLRAATGFVLGVGGCHMFDTPNGDWIYCHNGVTNKGLGLRVDSLAIGEHLDSEGIDGDISDYGRFLNLIVFETRTNKLFVHRGEHGNLSTDCNGNWSTRVVDNRFKTVDVPGWYELDGSFISKTKYPKHVVIDYAKYSISHRKPFLDQLENCDICGMQRYTVEESPELGCRACMACRSYNWTGEVKNDTV